MGVEPSPDVPKNEEVLNVNVGVLGHVDSGKTSLVKTLSTLLSTAALDKSKQSRERGMTLDLGFSCFFVDMPPHLKSKFPDKKKLQVTLVDCPGHASLIRTIIGGAQIIDMVLLVVDAFKGWQAQTTECLVLAELTSRHLVVALNKVDMFQPEERESELHRVKYTIKKRLQSTRFANAPLIGVSACVGGEKVAAITSEDGVSDSTNHNKNTTGPSTTTANNNNNNNNSNNETHNMDELLQALKDELPPPRRTPAGNFYFSIDHCFPIRGRGTVLTGTVLNGNIGVNEMLEFPALGLERKVKSMQMFKRQVQRIMQGDRAGICVSNLDAKLLERGIASSPGAVQLLRGAIALVRKVKYFPGILSIGTKFHISVGHTTVMATVTFWGAQELAEVTTTKNHRMQPEEEVKNDNGALAVTTTTPQQQKRKPQQAEEELNSLLGGEADIAGLPKLPFDFNQQFLQQDKLLESLDEMKKEKSKQSKSNTSSESSSPSLLHWAMLDFQTPVFCPLNSLIIGSRLDTAIDSNVGSSATLTNSSKNNNVDTLDSSKGSSSCRLAFSGRIIEKMDPEKDTDRIRLYTWREKRGVIARLGDPHRRTDDQKVVRYEVFGTDLFKKETNMKVFMGMKVCTERNPNDIGEIKSSFGTSGKFRVLFPAGTEAREGDALILKFKRFLHDPEKAMHQEDIILPSSRTGNRMENIAQGKKNKKKGGKNKAAAGGGRASVPNIAPGATLVITPSVTPAVSSAVSSAVTSASETAGVIVGEVVSIKGDVIESNGKHTMAIISGFFTPEVNIKEKVGSNVKIPSTKEEGTIAGPFGKAGKCKVTFVEGISASTVGAKAELQL